MKQPSSKPSRLTIPRKLVVVTVGVVVFGVLAGGYGWYRLGLRPANLSSTPTADVAFTVPAGWNAQTIAKELHQAGLIRDRNAFITYINLHGLRPRLKTGVYNLNATMSGDRIARLIASGQTLSQRLTVPEGYTIKQIRAQVAKYGISASDFDAALAAPHQQSVLDSKPTGVSLEGYLFPDSYDLGESLTATQLIDTMINTFALRVGEEYVKAFAAQGLSLHEGLTLASMVEREVSIAADRPVVAQIFLTRYKTGQSLGSDVTTQYASDLAGVPFNLEINSPYNTRKFTGLPPGPICNPGLSALDAVAKPAKTDYLYFLSGNDGKTYFAKTYTEHQQNIVKYLQ